MIIDKVEFKVANVNSDMLNASILLRRFQKINKLDFNLQISFDFENNDDYGYYLMTSAVDTLYTIYVNPTRCETYDEDSEHYPGTHLDFSIFGVIIHEFTHLLSNTVYKTILDDFKRDFPIKRLYLNTNSNRDVQEEYAESCALYLTNPYMLKLISLKHWKFFKKYFKSPLPTSQKKFLDIYKSVPYNLKQLILKRWGITVDVSLNKVIKLKKGTSYEK